jgi:alkylation response protein AidB-like acyl-CoA dehydrogenase
MLTRRTLERPLHGGVLADKQLIQAMMAESALELYAAKLMVLHAAYLIGTATGDEHCGRAPSVVTAALSPASSYATKCGTSSKGA